MPSTVVHLSVAALVGTALLGATFDRRALAVVLLAAAVPDLDTFVGLVVQGAHRSLLHTLLFPALAGAALASDTRRGDRSVIARRWGSRGVRVAWVALAGLIFGGILPDLFTNGVNAFYPLHDAFYTVDGRLVLSNERGVVQSFVEFGGDEPTRTTENTHYWTGVDPSPGPEQGDPERIFPVATSGMQLLVILLGTVTTGARLLDPRG